MKGLDTRDGLKLEGREGATSSSFYSYIVFLFFLDSASSVFSFILFSVSSQVFPYCFFS